MESTPQNESDQKEFDRKIHLNFLITILLQFIISLVGLAGNAVVLWLLGFCMKRNAFSVFILNFAGADFVYLSMQILNSVNFKIDLIFNPKFFYRSAFPYVASLSILTAINTEHCLSVLQPIWYRCHRPKHMSSVIWALIWALSLLLCILRLQFSGILFGESNKYLCKLVDFSIATWLIFSFVLLFGSNLVLLARILCGSQRLKLTRLYVIIVGLTVLVFLICGLPPAIYWFLLYWIPNTYKINGSTPYIVTVILLSYCVNSCANPIIYFFVGIYRQQQRQQRRSLKLILQRALQDDSEEDGSQGSPPQETLEMLENDHGS